MLFREKNKKKRKAKQVVNPIGSRRLGWAEENASFRFVEGQFIQPPNAANIREPKFMSFWRSFVRRSKSLKMHKVAIMQKHI